MVSSDLFDDVSEPLLALPGVAHGTMMGFPCLRIDGGFFASCDPRSGDLIVKLPAPRVAMMVESGSGKPFAPSGRAFREWVVIDDRNEERWICLLHQALNFVRNGEVRHTGSGGQTQRTPIAVRRWVDRARQTGRSGIPSVSLFEVSSTRLEQDP